jgi:hypothetical protein
MEDKMQRRQGTDKRGPKSHNGDWHLNIDDVPQAIGDALDSLWRKQCVDAIAQGQQPMGWHLFLIAAWVYYVKSMEENERKIIMGNANG